MAVNKSVLCLLQICSASFLFYSPKFSSFTLKTDISVSFSSFPGYNQSFIICSVYSTKYYFEALLNFHKVVFPYSEGLSFLHLTSKGENHPLSSV